VEETLFVDQVNTDHSVPALKDFLVTLLMKKLAAKRNYVPIIKIVQVIVFVKNTDVSLHWKLVVWQTSTANPVKFVSMDNVRPLVKQGIHADSMLNVKPSSTKNDVPARPLLLEMEKWSAFVCPTLAYQTKVVLPK
jgi:hypothetical protein